MHAPLESICFCGGEANPQRGMTENCLDGPFVFRLNENGVGPNLLVQVCTERGWREYTGDNASFKDRWNLWWKSGGFSQSYYKTLHPGQFINRIPKGNSICRKDNLVRHLKCMKKIYGSMYDFSPLGYNLPSEYTRLAADCSRCEKDDRIWICKPVGQSQGKGIFLFRKLSDLTYDSVAVVQRYIQNPLLIGGYKFDLRLYVCVPSYSPLAIYVYNEGLARFATEKFSLENLDDPLRHLTNFSLNKLGPGYSERKERVGAGCKWTFRQLRRYLAQAGYCDWLLWQQIACIISLTILSQAAGIPRSSNCFEFFGFDVLIDENLKPWLLEVNVSPALSNDCEVDSEVKKPLLHDLFDLLGLPVRNTGLSLFTIWNSTNSIEENDDDPARCFPGRCQKARCKLGREALALVDVCPEARNLLRQTPEVCSDNWSRHNSLLSEKTLRRGFKGTVNEESPTNSVWDNGKDWKNPSAREGGWIRVYPTTMKKSANSNVFQTSFSEIPRVIDKEIKNNVLCIQKYLKSAKNIQRQFGKQGDAVCNVMLQRALDMNGQVWLPEK
ncbi:probable tubulin polyglutamylase TTLL2 isoform X1 [Belonocnema kinseyi]|uniref:probable tubulin polyglutamylase TTLL2 isoform X1 n=1 Tax=Belonocnema kinseyi TaxID=2817044 RepID=UPI00143D35A6|nr:probable tubulin polyglutamylase TTLL2 isoform X1 [Belonocnema kinseyi]XP_033213222.1 probable tubulin polyglutamylase TTLL2 isoform X1 [Belonocnema kinseyi]XP_033213231.1 probable tubulin polyglutamylase TTLL2 isoform X1 [Belonocnema kinseyi]XP_033213237.1 probable tubulin polyglutamylase TTLL2 isoform X1 [Belonocnema kinseyi]